VSHETGGEQLVRDVEVLEGPNLLVEPEDDVLDLFERDGVPPPCGSSVRAILAAAMLAH
jgi:hypothetical protein